MMNNSTTETKRSTNLNDAYWAWLTEIARDCQNRGITVQQMLERVKTFDAVPTHKFIHEMYAKPIIKQQYFKDTSTKCTNQELQHVIDALTVIFSEGLDTDIPFDPNMHNLVKYYENQ